MHTDAIALKLGRVALGDCSPRAPRIRTCPIKAAGPSWHAVATDGTPGGPRSPAGADDASASDRAVRRVIWPPRRRRDSRRFKIYVAAVRNRFSAGELPVIP